MRGKQIGLGLLSALGAMMILGAGSSPAATIVQSGSTYGGWTITFPAGIGLVVSTTGNNTLTLEKFAAFANNSTLNITFTQTVASADSFIDISDETITNLTGGGWTGFQFSTSADASITASFAPPNGGTSGVLYSAKTLMGSDQVDYTGTQANGTTSIWGVGSDGDLIIAANPNGEGNQVVTFGEQPGTGGMTPPPPNTVPLPAAAWPSAMGLLMVVAWGWMRSRRAKTA